MERSKNKFSEVPTKKLPKSQPTTCSNTAKTIPKKSVYHFSEKDTNEVELPQRKNELPTWNLSTERLKFMSQVNTMTIKIRRIDLLPKVVSQLPTYNSSQPRRQKPSFIVKYSLPHEKDDVTVCASKANAIKSKTVLEQILHFDSLTGKVFEIPSIFRLNVFFIFM